MKLSQANLFRNKNTGLKNELLLIGFLFCLSSLNAQLKDNIKLGIEAGTFLLSQNSENTGLFLNVEPKVKITKNNFIGFRFGIAVNSHEFELSDAVSFRIDPTFDHGIVSFTPTFDYYLNENNLRPYIGAGIGYHVMPDPIELFPTDVAKPSENILDGTVNDRMGFLVRGGIESSKFRFGLEYNFILKADITLPNGETIGTVDNSYLGLSIGYIVGGG